MKLSPSNITLSIISTSSSSLFVQFPLGIGMNYTISFFVGSVEYSASNSLVSTFSYQRNLPFSILPPEFCSFFHAGPTIASISPSVVAGSITATIIGTGFGVRDYTLTASFGATSCDFVTFTSDSRINVKVSHGTGKHSFQVNVYGQYATISAAYAIPILNDAFRANFPCSSAVLVQVSGIYFGISDSSVNAQLGTTHCESSSWQASSSIYCKWSRGFGTRLQVAATVSSQIGSMTSAVSYDRLFISSPSSFNAPCFSPGSMLLFGRGFGFPFQDVTLAIGGSALTGSVISSDSSVYSTIVPGIGTGLSVSITIDSVSGSKLNIFSYDGTTWKNSFCGTKTFMIFTLFFSCPCFQCIAPVVAHIWSDGFDPFRQELCILVFSTCSFCGSLQLCCSLVYVRYQYLLHYDSGLGHAAACTCERQCGARLFFCSCQLLW